MVASAVENDSLSEHEFDSCGDIPSTDSDGAPASPDDQFHPEANESPRPALVVHPSWLSLMLCPLAVNSAGLMSICGKCAKALGKKHPTMPKGAIADCNFPGVLSRFPELARLTHAEKSLLSPVSSMSSMHSFPTLILASLITQTYHAVPPT